MTRHLERLFLVGGLLMFSTLLHAQLPGIGAPSMGMGMGTPPPGLDGFPDARFERIAPKIGDMIPDLTIVDRDGEPVNLRDLTGENYTVLVLGCLT